jgi:hypothetical protein
MRPNKYCQRACDAPLPEGAHISDEAEKQMKLTGWPVNEEQTTREIYAAAAKIREARPRDLTGYDNGEAEIPQGVSFNLAEPRQRR